MKKIQTLIVAAIVICSAVMLSQPVVAQSGADSIKDGLDSISNKDNKGNVTENTDLVGTVGTLVEVFMFLIGAVSVVMIIFGGFKYVTSAGESSAVSSAKNTIMYAVIGLVVAVLAYAIVDFVVGAFNAPKTWADCQKIEDLDERKACQKRMIEKGVNDLPDSVKTRGTR